MGSALQVCGYESENSSTHRGEKLPEYVNFLHGYNNYQFSTTNTSLKKLHGGLLILFQQDNFDFVKNPHFENLKDQATQLQNQLKKKQQASKDVKDSRDKEFITFKNQKDEKKIVDLNFKNIAVIFTTDLKNSSEFRARAQAFFKDFYLSFQARQIVITQFPSYLKRSKDVDFNVFVDAFLKSDGDKAQQVTIRAITKQSNTFFKKAIRSIKNNYEGK